MTAHKNTKREARLELIQDAMIVRDLKDKTEHPAVYIALERLLVLIKQLRAEI